MSNEIAATVSHIAHLAESKKLKYTKRTIKGRTRISLTSPKGTRMSVVIENDGTAAGTRFNADGSARITNEYSSLKHTIRAVGRWGRNDYR